MIRYARKATYRGTTLRMLRLHKLVLEVVITHNDEVNGITLRALWDRRG